MTLFALLTPPFGVRAYLDARAQDRARDLLPRSSGLTPAWWRFEDMSTLDCVLITERMVI